MYKQHETTEVWTPDDRMSAKEFYRLIREIGENAITDYDDAFYVEGDWQIRFSPVRTPLS